jgi:hypothetical protein
MSSVNVDRHLSHRKVLSKLICPIQGYVEEIKALGIVHEVLRRVIIALCFPVGRDIFPVVE